MPSLLVTNDFPPKLGGIQSYLYELWRRLPSVETVVFTTAHKDATAWDARQTFRVVRSRKKVLLPTRALARDVDALAREIGADVIFLDPMLPLGRIGPRLRSAPYVAVTHGAEITVPGAVPGLRHLGRRVLLGAAAVVAAGGYPARQATRVAGRALSGIVVPPGVDGERFHPLDAGERRESRIAFGLDPDRPLVLGLSRLVPRKGFDVVIDAVTGLRDVQLALAGAGRDLGRLERRAIRSGADVTFLGRLPDDELPRLYGCADAFAMCCRERWAGLEAEGFGIVFLEAAACGGALGGRPQRRRGRGGRRRGDGVRRRAPRRHERALRARRALPRPGPAVRDGARRAAGRSVSTPTTISRRASCRSPAAISRLFRSFPADAFLPSPKIGPPR